jgi:hypothetical protein
MARRGRPRDRHKEQFWRQTLQRFERSGLSAAQFCRSQHLPLSSFWAWKRTLRLRDQRPQPTPQPGPTARPAGPSKPAAVPFFVPLRLPQDSPQDAPATQELFLEILLPNGLRLRLPQHADTQVLQRLLPLLRGASC